MYRNIQWNPPLVFLRQEIRRRRPKMAQVYFHCSSSREVRVDQLGAVVSDLAEARDYAASVVRSMIMEKSAQDWRDWVVHVSDDFDDEIFAVPFASVLGKPH
jgi:hypothetical protein